MARKPKISDTNLQSLVRNFSNSKGFLPAVAEIASWGASTDRAAIARRVVEAEERQALARRAAVEDRQQRLNHICELMEQELTPADVYRLAQELASKVEHFDTNRLYHDEGANPVEATRSVLAQLGQANEVLAHLGYCD